MSSIDFFGWLSERGGASVDMQTFVESVSLDLSSGVIRNPRFPTIRKNNSEGLIGFLVAIYKSTGVRGRFKSEEIQTK